MAGESLGVRESQLFVDASVSRQLLILNLLSVVKLVVHLLFLLHCPRAIVRVRAQIDITQVTIFDDIHGALLSTILLVFCHKRVSVIAELYGLHTRR